MSERSLIYTEGKPHRKGDRKHIQRQLKIISRHFKKILHSSFQALLFQDFILTTSQEWPDPPVIAGKVSGKKINEGSQQGSG